MSNDALKAVVVISTVSMAVAAAAYCAIKKKEQLEEQPDLGTVKSNTRGVYYERKIFGINLKVKLV